MAYRLLDLFTGGGGCAVGYARAGFEVTGVDVLPMPMNPTIDLHQGDALGWLDPATLAGFDLVHASPPCKEFTTLNAGRRRTYPQLLTPVRDALTRWGGPYIIENVVGAPLIDPIMLCGSMFGLGLADGTSILQRHRLFESNMPLSPPGECQCGGKDIVGVYGTGGAWTRQTPGGGGSKVSGPRAAEALGVTWTTHQGVLSQMIPPAYTEHLGRQAIAFLDARASQGTAVDGVRQAAP